MKFLRVTALFLVAVATAGGIFAKPSPLTSEQKAFLDLVRASALQYTQKLPDFICTQITHREVSSAQTIPLSTTGSSLVSIGSGTVLFRDEIREELTFFHQREKYTVIAIDGQKVVGVRHMDITGAISAGEFGSELHSIFAPRSHTVFTWNRETKLRGHRVWVFTFEVPAEVGVRVFDKQSAQEALAPYGGQIYVDAATKDILRITSRVHLPKGFHITVASRTVDYKQVRITGTSFNLPFHSEIHIKDSGKLYDNKIDFKNYHRFAVESTIHYGDKGTQ